jgi:hypothetical protein
LCAEAAPKIIANAMGDNSTIEMNVRRLIAENGGPGSVDTTGEPTPSNPTLVVDWAVEAFRAAGLDVHTESYTESASDSGSAAGEPGDEQKNVVAEIRGREKPDEIVILGTPLYSSLAHLWDLYGDCDAAVLIEAARDIVATGLVPRRTIRFILFTSDKPGILGSLAYVRAHHDELDHITAAIMFDPGPRRVAGYSLAGRHDIEPGVREALAPLDSLGALVDSFNAEVDEDNFNFLLEGVPNLFTQSGHSTGRFIDRPGSDPLAGVDLQELKRNAAIAGVSAFDVSEDLARLGPRLSRAEIELLLKQTDLENEMKQSGIWPAWENGQRGRQP